MGIGQLSEGLHGSGERRGLGLHFPTWPSLHFTQTGALHVYRGSEPDTNRTGPGKNPGL